MNRKLQIHIDQSSHCEENLSPSQPFESPSREDDNLQSYEGQSSEEEDSDDHQQEDSSYHHRAKTLSVNIYQNIETFGNTQHPKRSITQQLALNQSSKMPSGPNQLPLTPIDPLSYLHPPKINQDESLQTQVNRIITKVMTKSKISGGSSNAKTHSYQSQIEQVKKIDKINSQLLSQNTALMSQINKLQKKLAKGTKQSPRKKKHSANRSDLSKSRVQKANHNMVKEYKQKLAKALQLNSKLSSRLHTQKSRRRNNSQLVKSSTSGREASCDELKGLSTIRSFAKDQPSKMKDSSSIVDHRRRSNKSEVASQRAHVYCAQCQASIPGKHGLSPVFQLKEYEINHANIPPTNEFHLIPVQKYDIAIQAVPQEESILQQENQYYDNEQKRLQMLISSNKRLIQQYEEDFQRLSYG